MLGLGGNADGRIHLNLA